MKPRNSERCLLHQVNRRRFGVVARVRRWWSALDVVRVIGGGIRM